MKNMILMALTTLSLNASAAVAPYWDSVNQVTAALSAGSSGSGRVKSITEVAPLKYEIVTADVCAITVQLVAIAQPKGWVGPTKYEVKSSQTVCAPTK